MIECKIPAPDFHLIGTVSKLVLNKNKKVKSFELKTPEGDFHFKIPEKLHENSDYQLYPLIKLEVKGKVEISLKRSKIKYKLEQINVLSPNLNPVASKLKLSNDRNLPPKAIAESIKATRKNTNSKIKGKILVCQKSNCWKKGGKQTYQNITKELEKKGLNDRVKVQKTGCMGRCKSAPNLVVLPDKDRYKRFKPQKANALINNHFLDKDNA